MKVFASPVARSIPFDGSGASPVFATTNVQDAIIEARESSLGAARVTIVTTFNGNVSNNQWLGYSELMPGNEVPIRIPWNCVLKEISVSYRNSFLIVIPLGELVDGVLNIYKNGTAAGDIIYQNTFTNQAGGKIISGLSLTFAAGDLLRGRWTDSGDNPSDMAIVYSFAITD